MIVTDWTDYIFWGRCGECAWISFVTYSVKNAQDQTDDHIRISDHPSAEVVCVRPRDKPWWPYSIDTRIENALFDALEKGCTLAHPIKPNKRVFGLLESNKTNRGRLVVWNNPKNVEYHANRIREYFK
jgi:hypothetical protein